MLATNNILNLIIDEHPTFSDFFEDEIEIESPIEDIVDTFEGYISVVDDEHVRVRMFSRDSKMVFAMIDRNEFDARIVQGQYEVNTQFIWNFYERHDEIKLVQPIQCDKLGDHFEYINHRLEEVLRQNEQENED